MRLAGVVALGFAAEACLWAGRMFVHLPLGMRYLAAAVPQQLPPGSVPHTQAAVARPVARKVASANLANACFMFLPSAKGCQCL